ncbi:MAG: tRNA pseudouridine(38-40) synthase TruA [Rhodospirillaceae bacterium]|nr:tRNA pseudouridine(38-40) synthase TruA [Rhodospirillaceae bacterium]
MPRFKLTIEYDGTDFVGWQRQINGLSVQQVMEEAALAYCQTKIIVHGAGRTDAGVHALSQVAHVDLPRHDDGRKVRDAFNAHLRPHPVAVIEAEEVSEDFHSRFQAIERSYVYRIVTRRAPVALEKNRAWWLPRDLNAVAMHEAAQRLVGQNDFTSFRATECQAKTPVKTLYSLDVERTGDTVEIRAQARSFLHHQVRNMVGTLSLVGEGKWTADDVTDALNAKSRPAGGPTAPPEGLYLAAVRYPD